MALSCALVSGGCADASRPEASTSAHRFATPPASTPSSPDAAPASPSPEVSQLMDGESLCPSGTTLIDRDHPDPTALDQVVYREHACVTRDGTLDGPYELLWSDGVVHERGAYDHGRRTGVWIEMGIGALDGSRTLGQHMRGAYVADRREGAWASYYAPGHPAWTGSFHDGQRTGHFIWYDRDGTAQQAGDFVDDQPDGSWTYWKSDGTVDHTATWSRGRQLGP
jgi:hypothetical protein